MTTTPKSRRITGPLKTWYDLHEALGHEAIGIAEDASGLTSDGLDAFANRFWAFEHELRAHSQVEDGIMFPAIVDRGGDIDGDLGAEHRAEQLATYSFGSALLRATADRTKDALAGLAGPATELRDSLLAHLASEETTALTQVDGLFADDEQAALFHTIISSLPPDPHLQPWVAAALSPAHLEARLRNIASSTPDPVMAGLMSQIHDGVDAGTWDEVEARTPELAALLTSDSTS